MREQSMRQREREEKLTKICTSIDAWSHLCVCVCVYTHAGTLYSKLQACRLELYQGGTEVMGRKYSRTPLYHSVCEKHTYTIIFNKRASQLHRFCNINWQNQTVTVMNADGKSDLEGAFPPNGSWGCVPTLAATKQLDLPTFCTVYYYKISIFALYKNAKISTKCKWPRKIINKNNL